MLRDCISAWMDVDAAMSLAKVPFDAAAEAEPAAATPAMISVRDERVFTAVRWVIFLYSM
ncbi:hypothetical protein BN1263550087 [Stenotrophomonas indicatrix]|jgi:hypothetical protein|nr:hypothetical protein BN1263550087 [Stenotrophomonas indicatrix]